MSEAEPLTLEQATARIRDHEATIAALKQSLTESLNLTREKHMQLLKRAGLSTADLEKQIRQQP